MARRCVLVLCLAVLVLPACGGDEIETTQTAGLTDESTCGEFVNEATTSEQIAYLDGRDDWAVVGGSDDRRITVFINTCSAALLNSTEVDVPLSEVTP